MTSILNWISFIIGIAVVMIVKMIDINIKFWPFFCIVSIPAFLLGFLWNGFVWIVIFLYLAFLFIKSLVSMIYGDDIKFDDF